ncbi:MAG TPA: hypothetical protein ENJ21_03830 [Chromatiaceae bacterium]|nr:hypothetical protein [Chromatiaceae bacterium]
MSFWRSLTKPFSSSKSLPEPPLRGDITDREKLAQLFETARDDDEIVNIRIFGHNGVYATVILEVDKEKGYLILDGFSDPDGHHALLRHKRFLAGIDVENVPLKFETTLTAVGVQDDIPFYKVSMPRKARYLQRRTRHRIDLLDKDTRFSGHHPAEITPLNGFLKNISEQGATIILDQPLHLLRREPLTGCALDLPGIRTIRTDMLVRHASIDEARGITLVGADFKKADKSVQRRVKKAIAKLGREARAKKSAADQAVEDQALLAAALAAEDIPGENRDTEDAGTRTLDLPEDLASVASTSETQAASSATSEALPANGIETLAESDGDTSGFGWRIKKAVERAKDEKTTEVTDNEDTSEPKQDTLDLPDDLIAGTEAAGDVDTDDKPPEDALKVRAR